MPYTLTPRKVCLLHCLSGDFLRVKMTTKKFIPNKPKFETHGLAWA